MKDIFTDLYNKVLGFFRQTEKKEEESTKEVACNRLKFVLMQDRTNLTPELMDRMRKELIELLSKYVEMDKEALELGFEQEGNQMALMLSIPVLRAREEAEIEATLAEEDAKKTEKREALPEDEESTESVEGSENIQDSESAPESTDISTEQNEEPVNSENTEATDEQKGENSVGETPKKKPKAIKE